MSDILKIQFDKIRQDNKYKELMDALERGFEKFGIDFYLVGALARDVWMKGVHNIQPKRATMDIDFGLLVKSSIIFTELKDYLIGIEGFVPYKDNAFVLIWKDKTQVDLIPFGELEKEGVVTIKGTGFTTMNVEGFQEVFYEGSTEIDTEDKRHFKVCNLPGIIILKLIAWDDRPEIRIDDIKDIAEILRHYFHINDNEIWVEHSDLFTEENVDLMEIAAQFLGREIGQIVLRNDKLKQRIIGILEKGILTENSNKLDELLARNLEKTIESCKALILHLLNGIKESKY
jgi:predicted nucleotidyltransferase